jgi:hypothetical protein
MCSVIGQRVGEFVYVLDELVLPDANAEAACEAFLARTMPLWVRDAEVEIRPRGAPPSNPQSGG